ncbi:MAG: hypothetical protein KBD14_00730 [Candidatus Pacebacteria bacterium]|nr:hypothetical protein [Candidatus Paceibacterota bacterium]
MRKFVKKFLKDVGFRFSQIKIQRGFEPLSSLNIPYYKGVTKEELGDWDTLEVSHRKLIH